MAGVEVEGPDGVEALEAVTGTLVFVARIVEALLANAEVGVGVAPATGDVGPAAATEVVAPAPGAPPPKENDCVASPAAQGAWSSTFAEVTARHTLAPLWG